MKKGEGYEGRAAACLHSRRRRYFRFLTAEGSFDCRFLIVDAGQRPASPPGRAIRTGLWLAQFLKGYMLNGEAYRKPVDPRPH
jgi:hypothetical protein